MTAFTATHSLTLTAAALGFVHVPQPELAPAYAIRGVAAFWVIQRVAAF